MIKQQMKFNLHLLPTPLMFEAVDGINTSYTFEAINGVNAKPFKAVNGMSHVHIKDSKQ
jgi:hypothetical protein